MKLICLDSNVVIFGILRRSKSPSEQHFVEMSHELIRLLEKAKCRVLLPTVCVGELLVPIPEQHHASELGKLRRDWRIVEYDVLAASQFAKMRHDKLSNRTLRDLRRGDPSSAKHQQIADVMIAATAIVHQAEILYTTDSRVKPLVGDYIKVE
ncbi:MAG: PIN domain-containing protein [Anaerolineaceae bacterium]|nr:PIN domain-containing protein [Anaerolineaceae bacterium]